MLPRSDAVPRFPVGDVRKKAYRPLRAASEAFTEIDVLALALLLISVTEVAIIVIEVPEAAEDGAT
jgi:hypothetical protein